MYKKLLAIYIDWLIDFQDIGNNGNECYKCKQTTKGNPPEYYIHNHPECGSNIEEWNKGKCDPPGKMFKHHLLTKILQYFMT